jgi:hypothetical protein
VAYTFHYYNENQHTMTTPRTQEPIDEFFTIIDLNDAQRVKEYLKDKDWKTLCAMTRTSATAANYAGFNCKWWAVQCKAWLRSC